MIRQQPAQPAVIDVVHATAHGFFSNGFLGLTLGAHEENDLPFPRQIGNELGGFLEELEGLLQVDNVNPVALPVDVFLHLGVPAPRLVAEVYSRLQEFLHGNVRQNLLPHDRCQVSGSERLVQLDA